MRIRFNSFILLKFLFTTSLLVSICTSRSFGQFTELTAIGGYTLGETFYTTDGYEVYVKDGATFGGSLAFYPRPTFDIAITYTRQETRVNFYDYFYIGYEDVDASVNYITIGGDGNKPVGSNGTSLFAGLDLGAAGLEPKDNTYTGRWKFAFDIHAGAKIFVSPVVGIRLQAGINFPVQYFGAAFTVGTGGSGAGVSATSTVSQVNFLGGLIIRMPSKN